MLSELTRDINALNPDFVLFPGDLIGDTGNNGWQAWRDTTAILGNRRLMTPGNHDRGPNSTYAAWQNTFNWLPSSHSFGGTKGVDAVDYFVDHGGVRFVSIATDRPGDIFGGGAPAASDWLAEVMQDVDSRNADPDPANDIEHVFTFSHRAVTTQNESNTGGVDGDWWQLMTGQTPTANAASTAFLAGHWHMYQPSRPDPRVDTIELISGTGGGGLEGAPHRNQHGFSLVTVDGGTVTSTFYGDRNGADGGWHFVNPLDRITVQQDGMVPTGELAVYEFDPRYPTQDTSKSDLSKGHELNWNGAVGTQQDPTQGDVLQLTGGYVDAKNIGDNNLAVLKDLSIAFHAKADGAQDATLISFGGAHGALNGSLNNQESANFAYVAEITNSGYLSLRWQHDDGSWETVTSNEVVADPTEWHHYEFQRDADTKAVGFFVDGQPLGQALGFENLPTGGGSGSFYIGSSAGGANSFNGWLDEITISSAAIELVPFDRWRLQFRRVHQRTGLVDLRRLTRWQRTGSNGLERRRLHQLPGLPDIPGLVREHQRHRNLRENAGNRTRTGHLHAHPHPRLGLAGP